MTFGGVEMGVAGDNHAGFNEVGEQHVLGGAALVGGYHIFETGDVGDGVLHVEETAGAAVALVAHHHCRPLAVAHGAGAAVGQKVDVNIVGFQHENVVVGFFEPFLAFGAGAFLDGFNHLDFP